MKHIKRHLKGKKILITGGTGSFGRSVVGTLLKYDVAGIVVFSRDEKKQHDMRNFYDNQKLRFIIGDVRDRESVDQLFRDNPVDYVFHAAALKQVPSCEFFPLEAVKTNVLGASNVLQASTKYGVSRIVVLSTDKAAYPINVMGITKALMEKVMIANARLATKNNHNTIFCGVRYGNVLYTRGSVIPYFISQMYEGEPLSVTDKNMTRFLLPLSLAVELVLFALIRGKQGHMYIRKAPVATMGTVAQALCELFDYATGYEEVGIRVGEKMHETLVTNQEMVRARDLGEYFELPPESQGLEYSKYFKGVYQPEIPNYHEHRSYPSTQELNVAETKKLLRTIPQIKDKLKKWREKKKN